MAEICGIGSQSGREGEMIACGLPLGHADAHAWANLPTFTDGLTGTEKAAKALLDHIYEFGSIVSQEYLDALDSALHADVKDKRHWPPEPIDLSGDNLVTVKGG